MRTIANIDRSIRRNIAKMLKLHPEIDRMDAWSWQAAWNAEPKLRARDKALYLERGFAQIGHEVPADRKAA